MSMADAGGLPVKPVLPGCHVQVENASGWDGKAGVVEKVMGGRALVALEAVDEIGKRLLRVWLPALALKVVDPPKPQG